MSPAGRDPVEKDDEKASEAPSEARAAQDAQSSLMMSPPLPVGRVLAQAASAPAGRNVAEIASEDEYEASAKLNGDDGRGREGEGQATQAEEAQAKDLATAAVSVSPIPSGTLPATAAAEQTQPGPAHGPAPESVQRTALDGKGGHGTAPVTNLAGPGPTSVQAASNEADSATSAVTEPRDGGSPFADVLSGVSPEAAKDLMAATVPTASTESIAANSSLEAPASLPTPHQGAPVPIGAVPMTIGLRSLSGSSHFEIRLDPVDLGRIDVRLEIDKDLGTVTTSVVVDRPDTLALLQRDSGNLQQALAQAGLDPGAGISLSLRSDGMAGDRGSGDPRSEGRGTDGRGGPPSADPSLPQPLTDYVAPRMLRGIAGIDIRI
ncbi:flagellar hook-length control protein FliK [uncultured Methylobacterium sp.]|uniref:flagellar hook-length control protein FliK n=1 Tax=uncultured Methylobacterium sp. TaxID=157278 RepID=UPI0035CCA6D9